mgnify:CR=1 FL=1
MTWPPPARNGALMDMAHATRTPCTCHARHAHTRRAHVPQVRPAARLPGADVGGVGDARALLAVLLPNLLLPRLPAVLGLLRFRVHHGARDRPRPRLQPPQHLQRRQPGRDGRRGHGPGRVHGPAPSRAADAATRGCRLDHVLRSQAPRPNLPLSGRRAGEEARLDSRDA